MSLKTVLIVDDEPNILKFVAAALRSSGYVVLQAADGVTALELAARHQGPINVLLTDVRMPGLLGPEVCERLRQQRPETHCLLMSGDAAGVEVSGVAFLAKPFGIPDLLRSIRRILDTAPSQPFEPARSGRPALPSSRRR